MKYAFVLLTLLLSMTAKAGITNETASHKVLKTVTPHTDPTTKAVTYDTCHYYFDADGLLLWEQRQTMRYVYEYNANKQKTKRTNLSWVEAFKEYINVGYETYTYNADGTINTLEKYQPKYNSDGYDVTKYVYTTYENGIATAYDHYYNDVLWYNYQVTITKNTKGQVTKLVTKQNDSDNKTKKWESYMTEEITYQSNGDVKTYTTTPYKKDAEVATYYYGEIDSKYAPANLTGGSENGKVKLTWDAVSGVNEYVVTFDQTYILTKTNSFEKVVNTGSRDFIVQSVVDGKWLNCAQPVTLVINDNNKIAVSNLSAGNVYTETVRADDGSNREFYCIELKWSKPLSSSEIVGYTIYYDSEEFGKENPLSISDKDATSYTLRVDPYEVRATDANGNLAEGLDVPVYIVVNYASGVSEKSNVITVNPYKSITTGIKETTIPVANAAKYNIAGQQTNQPKGIYITNGKKFVNK